MNDNFPNDIIPPEKKRSVRDIPLPHKNKETKPQSDISGIKKTSDNFDDFKKDTKTSTPPVQEFERREKYQKPRNPKKTIFISLIFLVILVMIVLGFATRAKSEITVFPRQATVAVAIEKIGANQEISSSATNTLALTTVTKTRKASQVVEANGKEYVEKKASGKIIVYNGFSESDYSLIKNTRFETPEGLVYRVAHSITIPGKTVTETEEIPGSLEIEVFADDVGDSYNIGLSDFTIPGFKGLTQFDHFYARSKTAMSGGFAGEQYVVKEEDLAKIEEELQEQLRSDLKKEVETMEGYVYVDDIEGYEFNLLPQASGDDSGAKITVEGNLTGLQFNKDDLEDSIIENALESSTNLDLIHVSNLKDLSITIEETEEDNLKINISGDAQLLWEIDTENLKKALSGIRRSDLNTILQSHEGVARAETSLPFWSSKLPRNTDKITITVEGDSIDE